MHSLTTDALLLIGDLLPSPTCHRAILVNHQWHDLFSRSLYRTASLRNLSQLQSFLKQILLRPSLSRVVRELDFSEWTSSSSSSSSPSSPPSASTSSPQLEADDIALFSAHANSHSLSPPEHTQWEKDLLDGVDEAWIALLLCTVPNLQILDLIYPSSLDSRGYLDRLFERAVAACPLEGNIDEQNAFRRLSRVSLRQGPTKPEDEKGVFSMKQMMPFLRMRGLRELSVDSLVEYEAGPTETQQEDAEGDDQREEEEEEAKSNALSNITFTTSNGAKGLAELLSGCPGLKSFKYQHSDAHCLAEGFQPAAFRETLTLHKSSLETLWLDNLGEHLPFTISGLNESCDQWFGSFAEFTAMKELRARLTNLLDVQYDFEPSIPLKEVLPGSIEKLVIEDCKERSLGMLVTQIKGLLEGKKFQSLKTVSVEGCFHDDEDTSGDAGGRVIKERVFEGVMPLSEACEKAGVSFTVWDRMCR
ncbi:hypothetical protein BDV18DRAFT_160362 [Aspergillus unguis]